MPRTTFKRSGIAHLGFTYVGDGHAVAVARVMMVLTMDSTVLQRYAHWCAERGLLVDGTAGRRTKSAILLDSGHLFLSAMNADTLWKRLAHAVRASAAVRERQEG